MDEYFKKEITYVFEGRTLRFNVGETLFSTFAIDHGTDVFLRSLNPQNSPKNILDLGCGYGPIGICLAHKYPKSQVTLVDRDLLAVRYASHNIANNQLTNATATGSVGLEAVDDKKFDLIASNIPAKIGDQAITQEFMLSPYNHLSPNGELWIVVVNALNRLIPKIASHHQLHLTLIRNRKGHTVYRIIKPSC